MPTPISLDAVVLQRGSFILDVPKLDIESGQVVGLVGANGAGKSTLIDLMAGKLRPSKGTVRTAGFDPVADPVNARLAAAHMVDEQPVLDLPLERVLDLIAGFYPTWDHELCARLIERFQLQKDKRASQLSKGEGTRLRLLLAMAWRPQILLLDEPGTGLDPRLRRAMLSEVLEIVRDPRRTVLFSTHQVDDVERVCDRLLLLSKGRIIADGPADSVVPDGATLEQMLVELP